MKTGTNIIPWTTGDLRRLVEMYTAGETIKDIAAELGRTESAVTSKVHQLREASRPDLPARERGPKSHRPWNTKDVQRLRELYAQGVPVVDIARELGRTQAATAAYAQYLHIRREGDQGYTAWTYDDEFKLAQLWRQGATLDEIAEAVGHSKESTKRKVAILRNKHGVEVVPYRYSWRRGKK